MNTIYSNGIDFDTGNYTIPPMEIDELDALIRGDKPPENIKQLEFRARPQQHLGVKEGVDVKSLAESGWAVIFAEDADPAVEQALQPLLALREQQAGPRFHRYTYQAGTSKDRFLARHGMGPGPADPDRVPYYLLIVGSPEKISYRFQSQLDVMYAVGRIDFATAADYAAYAESVVAAETGQVQRPRQATFFGVTHANGDPATRQSLEFLIDPLVQSLGATAGWSVEAVRNAMADKPALRRRLGGDQTPALLFTASHGLRVSTEGAHQLSQLEYQGALVCADWPGPGTKFTDEAFLFAGRDLVQTPDADLRGMIALFFACFGAGTPQEDLFSRLKRIQLGQEPGPALQLTPQPFVADLPRRMLSAPAGGALAVVGHVERCWPSSFVWKAKSDGTVPPQTAAFESTLKQLMTGYPVGAAVEFLNHRYAELATMLKDYLEAIEFGDRYDRVEFANVWMAANDAQWYTIIGDPAVRLPATGNAAAHRDRPDRNSIALATPTLTAQAETELAEVLAELAAAETRVYYDAAADSQARDAYYAAVDPQVGPAELYQQLSALVRTTHARQLRYKPSRHVYPWVDLQPDRKLRSIYSDLTYDPATLIQEDFRIEAERAQRANEVLARVASSEVDLLAEEFSLLEAALPYNCEHVVPQSWFGKQEPMRGDLHHLFACESRCNSFRSNLAYFDFPDFLSVVRDDCGRRDENRFEPVSFQGKGAAARATLYFLLRYPGEIAAAGGEFDLDRLQVLLAWHEQSPPDEYERHRNMAIFELQGTRNPLIDFPAWARLIDLEPGFG